MLSRMRFRLGHKHIEQRSLTSNKCVDGERTWNCFFLEFKCENEIQVRNPIVGFEIQGRKMEFQSIGKEILK